MRYKKIVVAGGGVLGSQIAFQSAYTGFDVTILVRKEDNQEEIQRKLDELKETYLETIDSMKNGSMWAYGISDENFVPDDCIEKVNSVDVKISTSQIDSLSDCDLLIESITENIDVKRSFYQQISNLLSEKTVVVTNSSTLLPSKLAMYTGRPEKFLSLHFANSIWKNNITEVMGHDKTDKKYFDEVIKFSEKINMIPLPVTKEKSGYLLNSMLVPFLLSAMDLVANNVSDPESIDKAWKLGTGAPNGPFEIIDVVGLETAKNIVEQYQKVPSLINPLLKKMMLPYNYKGMLDILNKYISEGRLGRQTKKGFYKYNKNFEKK